jgi:serine/threonine-protein kinase
MIGRIGRGGMGDVWRAEDLVLRTEVALKLIDAPGRDGRERILHEVRVARQITHPAVCRVFDVGEAEGGIVFYTMEFVSGEDLASLLRRVGRLPSDRVVDIAHQLCAGLAAAHSQGVLHRDLKPANVLIDDQGQVRITDFGIAIPRAEAGVHHRTGTPGYMAPEQHTMGTTLSERTDVYALGVVLYELLVGRHPFPSSSSGVPPRPSSVVSHVDPQLEAVILKAISPLPNDRPALRARYGRVAAGHSSAPHDARIDAWRNAARWTRVGDRSGRCRSGGDRRGRVLVRDSARGTSLSEQDTVVLGRRREHHGRLGVRWRIKVALGGRPRSSRRS